MKRNFYTLVFAMLFAGTLFAQVPKKTLIEETTQASCPPCATQNPPFDALVSQNLDKLVIMKYQVWWPGFDPMYEENVEDVNTRVGYLGPNAAPNMYVNGGNFESLSAMTQARIDQLGALTSPISITLDHNLNDMTGAVDISVVIKNETSTDLPANTYRLITVLQEDEILYAVAPGTNGELDFKWVMRKMLPDGNGTPLSAGLAAGEEVTYDFSVTIPWYTKELGYLAATAWVENPTTREVIQAEHSAHKALAGEYPDLATSYILSGYDGYCDDAVDADFTIENDGTIDVTSFDISAVNADGSLTLVDSWTGMLAPGGMTSLSLTGFQLGEGANSLQAVITNIDGRPDKSGHNSTQDNSVFYIVANDAFGTELTEGFDITNLNDVPDNMLFEEDEINIITANSSHIGGFDDPLGGFGNSDGSVWIDFPTAAPGSTASFLFEKLDLSQSTGTYLEYNYAYALRGTNGSDRIIIEATSDCGQTWSTITDVVGSTITTAPATATTTRFFPRPDQWGASGKYDLSEFDGAAEVIVRFRGISGGAQAFWFDDIVIAATPVSSNDLSIINDLQTYPNPASDVVNIEFDLEETADLSITIQDMSGRVVEKLADASFTAGNHTMTWNPVNQGVYLVYFTNQNGVKTEKITVVK